MTTAERPVPRRFFVPPLDGEIVSVTRPIEELLLVLADGGDDDSPLPSTLHQPAATAIGSLRLAILHAAAVTLYAPDGRYEHEPLAVVTVDEGHLTILGAAVAELDAVQQSGKPPDVAEFLDAWADERGTTAEAVVALTSHFHQLCQLAWGPDHDLLAERVEHARTSLARTVLTDDQEAAYRRLRDRWVAIWHHGDPLARWQYQMVELIPSGLSPRRIARPNVTGDPRAFGRVGALRERRQLATATHARRPGGDVVVATSRIRAHTGVIDAVASRDAAGGPTTRRMSVWRARGGREVLRTRRVDAGLCRSFYRAYSEPLRPSMSSRRALARLSSTSEASRSMEYNRHRRPGPRPTFELPAHQPHDPIN